MNYIEYWVDFNFEAKNYSLGKRLLNEWLNKNKRKIEEIVYVEFFVCGYNGEVFGTTVWFSKENKLDFVIFNAYSPDRFLDGDIIIEAVLYIELKKLGYTMIDGSDLYPGSAVAIKPNTKLSLDKGLFYFVYIDGTKIETTDIHYKIIEKFITASSNP